MKRKMASFSTQTNFPHHSSIKASLRLEAGWDIGSVDGRLVLGSFTTGNASESERKVRRILRTCLEDYTFKATTWVQAWWSGATFQISGLTSAWRRFPSCLWVSRAQGESGRDYVEGFEECTRIFQGGVLARSVSRDRLVSRSGKSLAMTGSCIVTI